MQRMERIEEAKARETEALRDINRLVYLMPSQAGLFEQRTDKIYYFNNQTCLPGDTILANGNSGSDFLWGPNCYLKLQWTVTNTAAAVGNLNFGYGSIMNLIKEIRITHVSGEVLEYIQNVNLIANFRTRWGTSRSDQAKLDTLLGGVDQTITGSQYAGGFVYDINTQAGISATNQSIVYVPALAAGVSSGISTFTSMIPMSYLSGLFDRTDQFCPPALLSGSTIQIVLAPANEAYTASAATISITQIRPSFVYDSSKAFDAATRAVINDQSSYDGLQFVYSTYFNTYITSATNSVNFNIQQAATVTNYVVALFRPSVATGATLCTFQPTPTQYQWRIASDYKPQAPVVVNSFSLTLAGAQIPQSSEAYMQTLKTFETGLHSYSTEVGHGANISIYEFNNHAAGYGTTLERSACGLSLTGLPTNNASLLNFDSLKPVQTDRVDVFLSYIRVANLRGAGAIVDR